MKNNRLAVFIQIIAVQTHLLQTVSMNTDEVRQK